MAQRNEVICPFLRLGMVNEVCQSGSWDGGGVGKNDQNWEEVKGQVREDCRGAGEMDGEGSVSQRNTQQVWVKLPAECRSSACWLAVPQA